MSSKVNVVVQIELGHKATVRHLKTSDGFTHDWEVFVQGMDGAHIESFVEKVVFYLHSSFAKPRRVCKKPPFAVSEHGYGGFTLPIEVYFRSTGEPTKAKFDYDLFLQSIESSPIANVRREKLTFIAPADDFKRKLLHGGGTEVTNGQDSRINDKSSVSRPSSGAKTKPVVRHHTSTVPNNPNSDVDKKKLKIEPKKEANKPKGFKTDAFTALFGELIKTGVDQKILKEKTGKEREKNKEKEKSGKADSKKDKEKKDVKPLKKEHRKEKEHKKSDRDKDREKDKNKIEKHEKKHKDIDKHSSKDKLPEREPMKIEKKDVKKDHSKRSLSPSVISSENKKRKQEKKKEIEPHDKKERVAEESPSRHREKERKSNSEKDKVNDKLNKHPDKLKVNEREKISKSSIINKVITPISSPLTGPAPTPPFSSPKKEEKVLTVNNVKTKSEKPSRGRGRPPKEVKIRCEEVSPLPHLPPPPSVAAKSKPKPVVNHPPPPPPPQIPPPSPPPKAIPVSRSLSPSSSRSRSPSLSISSSSSPDRSRSSSASSRSSSQGSLRNSRSPSKSISRSSSRSRSRSSSSSVKSRCKSPSSVKSPTPSRSVSRSRSKSKSVPGSGGSCSSSCGSSPSRAPKIKRGAKDSVKPLQLLGINDCSSDSEEKNSHAKSSPIIIKSHKGKLTPSSSKSSPRLPPLINKAKINKTPNPISSDDDSDCDSSPHQSDEKNMQHRRKKGNTAAVPVAKDMTPSHEKQNNFNVATNGRVKVKEELVENKHVKNEFQSVIDFNQNYFSELLELRHKIVESMSDRNKIQEIVAIIDCNASYELSKSHFTFDLCSLDSQTIKKLQICLS